MQLFPKQQNPASLLALPFPVEQPEGQLAAFRALLDGTPTLTVYAVVGCRGPSSERLFIYEELAGMRAAQKGQLCLVPSHRWPCKEGRLSSGRNLP